MTDVVLILFSCIVCYFIAGIVHELGHILAGVLQGFKFLMLVVGPFGLKRDKNDKIVFYIERNTAYWGGIGGTFPPDENPDNFEKFARVLLFGPLASIIFGLVMLPLAIVTDILFFTLLCAMPIGMGIVSLIPMKTGAFYSDGGRWMRMRKEPTRRVELALWNIVQKAGLNQNYLDVNMDDVNVLIKDDDQSTKYMGHYFLYLHYKDRNNAVKSEEQKDILKELSSKVSKQISIIYPVD